MRTAYAEKLYTLWWVFISSYWLWAVTDGYLILNI
jgi:hypothetical protein